MDKESFKQIIKSKVIYENITMGIHNYCDRWCERCTHTNRCSVFKIEQEIVESKEELDIQNQQFWVSLNDMLEATIELMHEKMQEFGVNPEREVSRDDFITKSIGGEMVVISREYALDVAKWLNQHRKLILGKFDVLQNISDENAKFFSELIEVIQHYYILIATKTFRASLVYEDVANETDDARGSAKVTVIIIDRSIAAWSTLLKHLPAMEDDILKFLKTLSQVRRLLLAAFPAAMEFIRPGFDE